MSVIKQLVESQLSPTQSARVLEAVSCDPSVREWVDGEVSRAAVASALGLCLFELLLERVPTGVDYVAERVRAGEKVVFDHGAIRTINFGFGGTGALPGGEEAFRRILEPLGYRPVGTYPLTRLRMTGRAYCHSDHPTVIPQYFVSELHVDAFDSEFLHAARRVFKSSRDPIATAGRSLLNMLSARGSAPLAICVEGLPELIAAFGRQHDQPSFTDYQQLLAKSAEAAWIATEGNAFNHATDRVLDVEALAASERALGRPIKDSVEISASGRVRQTAYIADPVMRRFTHDGGEIEKVVPGSFYEFISRDIDPITRSLDLAFDSANATSIFGMTRAA